MRKCKYLMKRGADYMSEQGYNYLVTQIRGLFEVINGTSDGSPSRAAFQLVYERLPHQEREEMVSGLDAMTQCPDNIKKYRGVIPQRLIGVSPELREIRKTIEELVPCC